MFQVLTLISRSRGNCEYGAIMRYLTTQRNSAAAEVDERATVGSRTRIWQFVQIHQAVTIGADCTLGRGAYIGPGVWMGDRCKIQNHAVVHESAVLGDGVTIGPAAVLTNYRYPRAVNPGRAFATGADWDGVGVVVREGASIGARAVCVAPIVIGRWALILAGAVVLADVPDFALMVGAPARRIGWVGRAGMELEDLGDGNFVCPRTGEWYRETAGILSGSSGF